MFYSGMNGDAFSSPAYSIDSIFTLSSGMAQTIFFIALKNNVLLTDCIHQC